LKWRKETVGKREDRNTQQRGEQWETKGKIATRAQEGTRTHGRRENKKRQRKKWKAIDLHQNLEKVRALSPDS